MMAFFVEALKILSIVSLTMLKFIFGPTLGYGAGYSFFTTVLITIAGMMSSVLLFTYLGSYLRAKFIDRIFKKQRVFSKRSRKFVEIWKKYGVKGVAFLTPILLTPIGGTLLLTAYKTDKSKIIMYMLISGVFWSCVLSGLIYIFGETLLTIIV